MSRQPNVRRAALVLLTLGLGACGGGGGSDPAAGVPLGTTCTGSAPYELVTRAQPAVGRNAVVSIAGCTGAIAQPVWTQTAGPAVTLLSARTQTISFEPPAAGTYAFRLEFTDPAGTARTESVAVDVPAGGASALVVARASHSVRMGANVSVRAWPSAAAGADATITWTQVEGPAVLFLAAADPYVAIFTAPTVSHDAPIRLRATVRTAAGATDSDDVLVMVERYQQAPSGSDARIWSDTHVSRVYPYKAASPYASALVRCAYDAAQDITAQCPLSQLKFLAQETGGALPTVSQVMDRVLVSHDWLGKNFEDFLNTQDVSGDFRRMLMSTTAVVLGTHVRPSFYYAATGAIYLDADNFWLTPEQRDLVSEVPDFRSDFDRDLAYSGLWRYVQNNQSIFVFFDPRSRNVTRALSYLLNESGWLMYHELGHALDFLPPVVYGALNSNLGAWDNIGPRFSANQLTSDTVSAAFPLTSAVMRGLAQVKFFGATATATQIAYTPDQVAAFFANDSSTDEYNFSNSREDIAMTLEELLMNRRLGIQRDMAISDKIPATVTSGSQVIVRWGQRGRIGSPSIKPRAKAIAQALVPWFDATQVDALPAPLQMRAGQSWTSNLVLPAPLAPAAAREQPLLTREQLWLLRKELQRMEHHRHALRPRLPSSQ